MGSPAKNKYTIKPNYETITVVSNILMNSR